jgi:hypothetical protein
MDLVKSIFYPEDGGSRFFPCSKIHAVSPRIPLSWITTSRSILHNGEASQFAHSDRRTVAGISLHTRQSFCPCQPPTRIYLHPTTQTDPGGSPVYNGAGTTLTRSCMALRINSSAPIRFWRISTPLPIFVAGPCTTLVPVRRTTRRHIPQDHNLPILLLLAAQVHPHCDVHQMTSLHQHLFQDGRR